MLDALTQMPDGEQLCHGDFHPGNVIMTATGPILGSRGNPAADVARSSLLLAHAASLPGIAPARLIELGRSWFDRAYRKEYSKLRSMDLEEISTWRPIVATARLAENIPEERDRLLEIVMQAFPV